ncbi:MAG TPA: outer membrane beta-barrel protein [Microvirga sp.]|jgi:outer membrane immunogenic protein|nr:outer membrane beta-barrel protein [Microvirga sp.]
MKKLLLASAALIGFSSMAAAADLPMRAAPPAPVAVAPVFTWTGFYVGVHGAWIRPDTEIGVRGTARRIVLDEDGFGGGGQVGYLMQFGSIVAGIEADITATDVEQRRRFGRGGFSATLQSSMDYFGTVKGRLGVTFPSFLPFFQQSMIYVTGGLGYAGMEHGVTVRVPGALPGPRVFRAREEDTHMGFVIGGGTENAITNNISLKTETVYYSLDEDGDGRNGRGGRGLRGVRVEQDGWISKIGVNVRF